MPNLVDTFNTLLSAAQEQRYRQWAEQTGRGRDEADYDMRGAWLSGAGQGQNGHFPDTFKKPNHPTFSDESRYSTPANPGGHWSEGYPGKYAFWASPANLQYRTPEELQQYMQQTEPDTTLIFPWQYRLAGGR